MYEYLYEYFMSIVYYFVYYLSFIYRISCIIRVIIVQIYVRPDLRGLTKVQFKLRQYSQNPYKNEQISVLPFIRQQTRATVSPHVLFLNGTFVCYMFMYFFFEHISEASVVCLS